jgi:ABC-type glycerol-3-phosphate transport system permease component
VSKPLRDFVLKGDLARTLALGALLFAVFYPFLAMLNLSLKDSGQFQHDPIGVALPLHFDNYPEAWAVIQRYVLNSVLVSTASTVGAVALAAYSAYIFARFSFPGRELLFYLILSLMMVPGVLTLVPAFVLVKNLGLLNTYWVLIIPYVASGQVLGIFLMRSFFAALPEELFEAARVDGASSWTVFWRILIPLSKPILGTFAIMRVLSTWNDLVWPLTTISRKSLMTITLGLISFRSDEWTNWGGLFSGYTLASLPLLLLFVFTTRYFIRGLSSGAIKA